MNFFLHADRRVPNNVRRFGADWSGISVGWCGASPPKNNRDEGGDLFLRLIAWGKETSGERQHQLRTNSY
jgi:hypothetical protein